MARKTISLPSMASISTLTLTELNTNIRYFGNLANTRLRTVKQAYGPNYGPVLHQQKLASYGAQKVNASGLASSYSTRKAKTVQEGRSRLSNIIKGLSAKTSTISGIKSFRNKQKKMMSDKVGFNLSDNEFDNLIMLLNELKDQAGLDSDQILQISQEEITNKKFESFDELKEFLLDNSTNRIVTRVYEEAPGNQKIKKIDGKWVAIKDDKVTGALLDDVWISNQKIPGSNDKIFDHYEELYKTLKKRG